MQDYEPGVVESSGEMLVDWRRIRVLQAGAVCKALDIHLKSGYGDLPPFGAT